MSGLSISFSGADNIGKSTHIRLLKRSLSDRCFAAGGLFSYDEAWPTLSPDDFSRWWFSDITTEELTRLIFRAYVGRSLAVGQSRCQLALVDRGLDMFEAVCIATAMVKDGCDNVAATQRVLEIRNSVVSSGTEDVRILLTQMPI